MPAAAGLWLMPEPVEGAAERPFGVHPTRPAVAAPARAVFLPAAVAGLAGFVVLGLVTAVSPAFLGEVLGRETPALTGLVVLVVFGSSTVGQVGGRTVEPGRALRLGCGVLVVGAAVLAVSLSAASLPLLLAGGIIAGGGQGVAFAAGLAAQAESPGA